MRAFQDFSPGSFRLIRPVLMVLVRALHPRLFLARQPARSATACFLTPMLNVAALKTLPVPLAYGPLRLPKRAAACWCSLSLRLVGFFSNLVPYIFIYALKNKEQHPPKQHTCNSGGPRPSGTHAPWH